MADQASAVLGQASAVAGRATLVLRRARAIAAAVTTFALSLFSSPAAEAAPAAAGKPAVNFAPGLTTTAGIHDGIDYEFFSIVKRVDAEGSSVAYHWTRPDTSAPGGTVETDAISLTSTADLDAARRVILVYITGDPETFPGATHGHVSRTILRELKDKGEAAIVVGGAKSSGGSPLTALFAGRKYYRGTLKRIEKDDVPVSVLLDGQRTNLPAIHAKGTVSVGSDSGEVEFWVLDDPTYAMILKHNSLGASSQVVRIDNPPPRAASAGTQPDLANGLESSRCRWELHGVYFNTGSATLLSESAPVLSVVAQLLKAHPDWHVLVEGHTDNIGAAAANLSLSTRRAGAVRDALVTKLGVPASSIEAKGFGDARPVEDNATLEGRAHNRRVELSRRCP
jgi:outer membrane protein OmpA-like peptidoglycan-associated protein